MNQSPAQLIVALQGRLAEMRTHVSDLVEAFNPGLASSSSEFEAQCRQRLENSYFEDEVHDLQLSYFNAEALVNRLAREYASVPAEAMTIFDEDAFGRIKLILHIPFKPELYNLVKTNFETTLTYAGAFQATAVHLDIQAMYGIDINQRATLAGPVQLCGPLVIGAEVALGDGYWKTRTISGMAHIPVLYLEDDVGAEEVIQNVWLYLKGKGPLERFAQLSETSMVYPPRQPVAASLAA